MRRITSLAPAIALQLAAFMSTALIEVSQHWGESLLRVERFPVHRRLTVGPAAESDFVAPLDEPAVLCDLGTVHGDQGEVSIDASTDVEVGVGDVIFRVRAVEPEERVPLAIEFDWWLALAVAISAVFFLATLVMAVISVFLAAILQFVLGVLFALLGLSGAPQFFPVTPFIEPLPVVEAKFVPPEPVDSRGNGGSESDDRPFFVRATPTPIPTITPIPMGDIPSKKLARAREIESEMVRNVALLSVLKTENAGVLAMLDSSSLEDVAGVEGGVEGGVVSGILGTPGTLYGSGELGGLRGSGIGGGGTAEGIGGLGTRGAGPGTGFGAGTLGTGSGRKVGGGMVTLPRGEEETGDGTGTLPPEVIQRIVRQHLSAIRYCYERELAETPDLAGKIVLSWTIAEDGSVLHAGVASTTMNSQAVESCMTAQVRRWKFPSPNGGHVSVRYPFIFKTADGE